MGAHDASCGELAISREKQIPNNPYTKYLSISAREKLMEAQAMEEDLDLKGELQLLRTLLMEKMQNRTEESKDKDVLDIITGIKDLVKTSSTMIDKLQGYIPVTMLPVIFRQITDVIKLNVKDDDVLARIATQLGRVRVPRDRAEADRLARAVTEGKVPS